VRPTGVGSARQGRVVAPGFSGPGNPPAQDLAKPPLKGWQIPHTDEGRRSRFFSSSLADLIDRDVSLFEEVYLLKRVPSWTSSTTTRTVQRTKALFVDSGLCAHLVGRSVKRLVDDDTALGPLLETFVLGELARQLEWSETRATLHHSRTRDGIEVDALVEAADGRVAAFEVKSGETVRSDDFAPMRHLQQRLGERFHLGVVFHTGRQTLPFGDRLQAVPIDALWTKSHRAK
jgi:uncharacterized protein